MDVDADMMRDQTDDALAVGRRQSLARVGKAFTEPVDPEAPVGIEHDFDDGRVGEPGGDRRAERGAQHTRAARIRLRSHLLMLHDLSPAKTAGRRAQRSGTSKRDTKPAIATLKSRRRAMACK